MINLAEWLVDKKEDKKKDIKLNNSTETKPELLIIWMFLLYLIRNHYSIVNVRTNKSKLGS